MPAGFFDKLTNLTDLDLGVNNLSDLPAGLFGKLTNLTDLDLGFNDFTDFPAGVLDGASSLEKVVLWGNPGSPFHYFVLLEPQGKDSFNVKMSKPAPFPVTAYLTAVGGQLSKTSVDLPIGTSTARKVTVTRDSPGDTPVTVSVRVNIETKWGYQIVSNGVEVSGVRVITDVPRKLGSSQQGGEFHSVCDRTEAVRTAILSELADVEDCADVDADHLRILSYLYLGDSGVTSLKARDFDDFLLLDELSLRENGLTSLPAGIFSDDLTNLRHLNLNDNELTSFPEGVFDNLSSLTTLELSYNGIEQLPDGIFDGLTALQHLQLRSNRLEEMPEDFFDNLSSLTWLGLSYNGIEHLPDGIFDGLAALQYLSLAHNDIDELPDDIFDSVSDLRRLYLSNNNLTAVPSAVSGLSQLESLNLGENSIEDLPSGTFDSLTSLTSLYLSRNRIRELPEGVFDQLGQLEALYISTNRISELPEGVFDNLTYLEVLDFSRNSLIELPEGSFEGLTNLRSVSAEYNYVSPLVLTTRLERLGDTELAVKVVEAAPFDIEVELTADHGSLSTSTVTVAAGSTRSDSITVTPSGTDPVTVSMSSARFITDQSDRIAGIEIGLGRSLTPSQDTEANEQATGAPVITGTAVVGETLTASTSTIADANGVTASEFRFFWIHSDGETDSHISMTSEPEYTVTRADIGKSIKVRVKFTDDADYEETLTSTSTGMVPIATPQRPYWVEVHASDARELSVSWPAPHDGGSAITGYTVQWKKATGWDSWDTDADASSTTTDETAYTISGLTHGTRYTIRVIATNDLGNSPPSRPESAMAVARVSHEPNTPATGAPSISGTARVGETLTVDASGIADSDGRDHAIFAYQWLRVMGTTSSGTRISLHIQNATSASYLVTTDDVGHALEVLVSFIDDTGNRESRISAATAVAVATVPGAPASVDVQPSGTGRLTVSWEAPASDGGSPITGYKVQWKKATDSWDSSTDVFATTTTETSYTISSLSLQTEYTVRVVATNSAGDGPASEEASAIAYAQTSQQQDAVQNSPASGQPTINGTPAADETLTVGISGIADEDGLDNPSFTYQWLADDVDISGATGDSYTLTDSEVGTTLKVRVSFTDDAGNSETLTSAPVVSSQPTGLTATVSERAVVLRWNPPAEFRFLIQYQILRQRPEAGEAEPVAYIDTRTAETTHTDRDVEPGVLYLYRVKAVNLRGLSGEASQPVQIRTPRLTPVVNTPATGQPTIGGTPQVSETLTADTGGIADADGLDNVSYSYQWLADDAEISGATASGYTLVNSDGGKAIKVQVSFTDDAGNGESLTSEATAAIEARANNPSTGAPTISGSAQVGETLTADTSGVADGDGLESVAFSYQWLSGDGASETGIVGATSLTYTLLDDDEGKTVKVRVSFTDDAGNEETLTSEATAAVGAAAEEVVWESELTVGRVPNVFPDALGYSSSGDLGGSLSPEHFEIDGSVYSVQFLLHFAGGLWLGIDRELPVEFTLVAGESSYEGSESKVPVTGSGSGGYWWPSAISEWSVDESVQVSLSIQPQAPLGSREKAPLIANLRDIPSGHDGQTAFTFELRFGEEPEPDFSYKTLRDSAFTVTGGSVENARRLNKPSNIRWEITVRPDGNGEVTIILPATTDCEAEGAICTEDGRMLFNRIELTVAGPGG